MRHNPHPTRLLIQKLLQLAREVEDIFRSIPNAERTRNEWEGENFQIRLAVDPDRANLAGITNMDVANSSTSGLSGVTVATMQEGQKEIPVVARLRVNERAQLSDIQNVYVYGLQNNTKIPLVQVSSIEHDLVLAHGKENIVPEKRLQPQLPL